MQNNDKKKHLDGKDYIVEEPAELLAFLRLKLAQKSRNAVKTILSSGAVSVDGKKVTRHDHALRPGQTVRIASPDQMRYKQPKRLKVIYEDDELIAINKPAGLLTIATDLEKEQTAYHDVTDYVRRDNPKNRIFIIHRLDRDTSGVVLFAKNEELKYALQDSWNELVKTRGYTAVVEGTPRESEGTIHSWLKETKTHLMYSSHIPGDGQEAVTVYRVKQESKAYSLLQISLETGRKNQIRVHLKELGHPVAGDKKYGAATNPLGRLALHADTLELSHPISGNTMRFHCDAPSTFLSLLDNK